MLWLEVTGIVVLTLVAAYAIVRGWQLDTANALLRAENARLQAKDAQWQRFARAEGFGQTQVLPIASQSSHRR